MTSTNQIVSSWTMSGIHSAKANFFRNHDPFVKYHSHSDRTTKCSGSGSGGNTCTIYGSAFSPPTSYNNKKYFVVCTSNGCIAIWDYEASKYGSVGPLEPVLTVSVNGENNRFNSTVLYDLQFIEISNGDHLLVASGDPGILIYKWSHFEDAISSVSSSKPQCQYPSSAISIPKVTPITSFHPHPSPSAHYGESVEINCASYSKSENVLYGAAGDMFGCYQWDMSTEKLLGTFGGSNRFDRGIGHTDYLHVVKSIPDNEGSPGSQCVITGGEDGNMGWWEGKSRKLIELVNMQKVIDRNRDMFSQNNNPAPNSRTSWNIGSNSLWVSSMTTNSNWLAVCGGSECSNNSITSRASMGTTSSGFLSLWHLPTRTCTSGCITRENLNSVVYNQSLDCFVTGGNEGMISFWEPTNMVRSSRSWSSPPATYSISVDSNMMVVGGAGGKLDLFVDRIRVSELQCQS